MPSVLKISEAASLALHTVAHLSAVDERPVSAREIASRLGVSEAHLSKVLQRLSKSGLVRSTRGPKGGFQLVRGGRDLSLLDVYEAIEGPVGSAECLLGKPVCAGNCLLGDLLAEVTEQVRNRLSSARLEDLGDIFGGEDGTATEDRTDR